MMAVAILTLGAIGGTSVHHVWLRWDRARAEKREAKVRELLGDERLANIRLRPPRGGFAGVAALFGIDGPSHRRAVIAFEKINPLGRDQQLSRTAGSTIDACRRVPDGAPAVLLLSRPRPVSDLVRMLGPYSTRATEDLGGMKRVEFYTYGHLDVGVHEGAIVAVRVR
jgi:hypothetical protein